MSPFLGLSGPKHLKKNAPWSSFLASTTLENFTKRHGPSWAKFRKRKKKYFLPHGPSWPLYPKKILKTGKNNFLPFLGFPDPKGLHGARYTFFWEWPPGRDKLRECRRRWATTVLKVELQQFWSFHSVFGCMFSVAIWCIWCNLGCISGSSFWIFLGSLLKSDLLPLWSPYRHVKLQFAQNTPILTHNSSKLLTKTPNLLKTPSLVS